MSCEICGSEESVILSSSWLVPSGIHTCATCRCLGAEPIGAVEIYADVNNMDEALIDWFDGMLTYIENPRSGGGVYVEVGEIL